GQTFGRLFEEKLPLLALSLASAIVTYWAQHRAGAVVSAEIFPLSARLANAASAYARYLGKFVWPTQLAVFYPRAESIPLSHALAALAVACDFAFCCATWRQIGFWTDTYTLFAHALDVTDHNHIAHGYVGTELGKRGKTDEAIQHFQTALQIDPHYAEAHYNL